MAGQKAWNFIWDYFCLVADYPLRITGLSFEATDDPGKDPGNHLYQENPVILLLLGYPFKNRTTKTGLNQTWVI